ncbi:hypothetical protein C4B63_58g132 [Trypanosoma cruzi]|uniref:Uncharacterized protein n=1 Tax=Trypanosoma cruzi TaxID=5693 RepID=A0A2V2V5N0_TRYCR|nr:hypothetical protein C4B63_58g132 [Trypanosoma cruzi]
MEEIQNDLDVIRGALARSRCHAAAAPPAAALHDERGEGHHGGIADNPRNSSHHPTGVPHSPITGAAVDHDRLELKRLREQVSTLSACESEKTRIEVEMASKEAALRQCVQTSRTALQREKELQEQLHHATTSLQEKQVELTMWRERHQRLQREADLLRQEIDALAGQCDRLEVMLGELREAVQQAAGENDRLRSALQESQEERDALRRRQMEHDAVVEREAALQEELQAVLATNSESIAYLTAARAEIEARQQYWAAVQEEHVALQEALGAAQAAVRVWEARFVLEQAAPPLPMGNDETKPEVVVLVEVEAEAASPRSVHNETSRNNNSGPSDGSRRDVCEEEEGEEEESHELLLAALEAKVVDLALHLQEQRAVAEAANESYATIAAVVTLESRELLEARRLLASQRPEWTHLSETNQKLQAAALARESHVEALQELVVSLLEELTEQSLYCYELETQLAVRVVKGGMVSHTPGSSSAGETRRSNALHFLQQQQRNLKFCASGRRN